MSYYSPDAFQPPRIDPSIFQGPDLGGKDFYNNDNEGRTGYTQFAQHAAPGTGIFANWLRNRYQKTWDEYNAAAGQNPTMQWTDYLSNNQDNLRNEFSNMTPETRAQQTGVRPTRSARMRWM